MSKIRIKNFGPIKEGFDSDDGFMDIKKVTVFIGDQGSGKSSVAKLISTLCWMEKAINRGDAGSVVNKRMNFNTFQMICSYQGVKNYFLPNTEIEYEGNAFSIKIDRHEPPIISETNSNKYITPKIMYVPAERNLLSAVDNADKIKDLPSPLYTFLDEFERAQRELPEELSLPIGDITFEYDQYYKTAYIKGKDYKIKLIEASSGLQSLVPLYVVSRNLALSINKKKDSSRNNLDLLRAMRLQEEIEKVLLNDKLSDDLKKAALEIISLKYDNGCFLNIVEEPEQNLFPASQRQLLNSLVEFANMNEGNKLILTTHSPYIINYLSIAIQGSYLKQKIETTTKSPELLERLYKIVPEKSTVSGEDVVVYELKDGKIICLPTFEGIPSDKNYLNQSLAEGNRLFDSLLEIEQEL